MLETPTPWMLDTPGHCPIHGDLHDIAARTIGFELGGRGVMSCWVCAEDHLAAKFGRHPFGQAARSRRYDSIGHDLAADRRELLDHMEHCVEPECSCRQLAADLVPKSHRTMGKAIPAAVRKLMEVDLRAGLTTGQVADRYGVSIAVATRLRAALGIEPPRPQLTDEQASRAGEMMGTVPDHAVAAEVGCSRASITRLRKSLGIASYRDRRDAAARARAAAPAKLTTSYAATASA